jgi:lysozyme family protein
MASFDEVKTALVDAEGGYSNVSNDRGGETKWGVSKRSYPNLDIKSLTLDDACNKVYIPDFWNAYRLSEINAQQIANKIFLAIINMPPENAIKCVQRALNVCSMNESFLVDGVLGSQTIRGINSAPFGWFLDRLRVELGYYYLSVVKSNKSQTEFLEDWIGRALK